ncbi:MAG: tetratricopeptide repeat protein [Alphaproteobacteria bacterium]
MSGRKAGRGNVMQGHPPEFAQAMERGQKGDFQGALLLFRKAMARRPHADIASNIGYCLRRIGREEEARKSYSQALSINPLHADALANFSAMLVATQEFEEAERILRKAESVVSVNATLLVNFFTVLFCQARFDEAEGIVRRAVAINPNLPQARKNLSDLLLMRGQMEEGFELFETRNVALDLKLGDNVNAAPWRGEDLRGKTLFALTEQGYGDTLLFLRYGALVRKVGGRMVLLCRKELRRLLTNCPVVDALAHEGESLPSFDYHISLLSLPHMFRTSLATIPNQVPYIAVETALAAQWKTRIDAAAGGKLKVGVSWAGSASFWDDRRRSPGLKMVEPIFQTPSAHFFLLQMGEGRAALKDWVPPANVTDLGPEITDFADTAAMMANLDVVVSSCTSTAHLAGALGRPVWVMLHPVPYWVWMVGRPDTPWYPSARLFRQSEMGKWDSVVEAIRENLGKLTVG